MKVFILAYSSRRGVHNKGERAACGWSRKIETERDQEGEKQRHREIETERQKETETEMERDRERCINKEPTNTRFLQLAYYSLAEGLLLECA